MMSEERLDWKERQAINVTVYEILRSCQDGKDANGCLTVGMLNPAYSSAFNALIAFVESQVLAARAAASADDGLRKHLECYGHWMRTQHPKGINRLVGNPWTALAEIMEFIGLMRREGEWFLWLDPAPAPEPADELEAAIRTMLRVRGNPHHSAAELYDAVDRVLQADDARRKGADA